MGCNCMVKDRFFKLVGIPVSGILIPVLSGLVNVQYLHLVQLISSAFFFIILSHIIWQVAESMLSWLRNQESFHSRPYLRLITTILSTFILTAVIIVAGILIWQYAFLGKIELTPLIRTCLSGSVVAIVFALIYEVLLLTRESELNNQVVMHLDRELLHAEINVLK